MKKKLKIPFLWHMHQPLYKDLRTGIYHLPWVRLHSTYSYLDMISVLEKFPDIRVTFNVTPSLIWQLQDIASGGGENDKFLILSKKNAKDLDEDEKVFVIKNFFSCDQWKAIFPIKRYKELFELRGDKLDEDVLREKTGDFTEQDLRDLQVLFNLAWCGFTLKKNDTLIKKLFHKGKDFTEKEKLQLLSKQQEVTESILPLYKKLQDEGKIEISTTPFYHPILPLICRGKSGHGFDFAEDAAVQVDKAIDLYEKTFGRKPVGMWPAEGSVSPDIIPVLAEKGIKWIATDEGIVIESFKGRDIPREELIYNVFSAHSDGKNIDIIFRDIHLSNAISFRYSNMSARKAAIDLYDDLLGIKSDMDKLGGDHVVPIILDGENPWPYYDDGGEAFLKEVYSKLSTSSSFETCTAEECFNGIKERTRIDELYSGSWIDRNFNKWIGSPQKNKAWEYLEKARKELVTSGKASDEALEELYIAEGSDWFWWYDDFGTELNHIFDTLFRLHLRNIYELIGREAPYYLYEPVPGELSAQRLAVTTTPSEMARLPQVALVSPEAFPFAKTGGLADVAGSLPKALAELGCDTRIIMPYYKCVREGDFDIKLEKKGVKHSLLECGSEFNIYSNRTSGVTTYFIENDKFFDREGLYGTGKGDHKDNAFRFSFFSQAALACLKELDLKADVIHCNDWQTALIPFYLKYKLDKDGFYEGMRTLFTIHNMAYQGVFQKTVMKKIFIPESFFNMNDLEFYGKVNYMKGGILYSDAISTVSHKYAEEIMTKEFGCGLQGLLKARKNVLYGIANGVDYSVWGPRNDKFIKANFDAETLDKKAECKKDLIKHAGLSIADGAPVIGSVTRLADQKGMDLFAGIMADVVKLGFGVVILGSGDDNYNEIFRTLAAKYPGKVYVCNDFNDELAHKIEAGADMFVMPSRYEPCGLNQMYSIKYGTIPIVRATGGLDDVIVDYDEEREKSNGFKFGKASGKELLKAIARALKVYNEKKAWECLKLRAMAGDFSWENSARQYLMLYRKIVG